MIGRELSGALPPAPAIQRSDSGAVFPTPWAARAFALAIALQDKGVFSAGEWADALGAEVRRDGHGDPANAETYWRAWLAALEELLRRKAVAGADDLATLQESWRRAAEATPHGEPIELRAEPHA